MICDSVFISVVALLVSAFSAVTAFLTFRDAQRTSRTQLRAWVCYDDVTIHPILESGSPTGLAFSIRWKNAGSTPARRVHIALDRRVFDTEEQALSYQFSAVDVDESLSGVIGPGITMDSPIGSLPLTEFRSGSTVIWSRVTYQDIFSEEVRESEIRTLISSYPTAGDNINFVWQVIGNSKGS